ncbi:hypothetical protein ACHQM5_028523 [Ranunculus cassubicifolius]
MKNSPSSLPLSISISLNIKSHVPNSGEDDICSSLMEVEQLPSSKINSRADQEYFLQIGGGSRHLLSNSAIEQIDILPFLVRESIRMALSQERD